METNLFLQIVTFIVGIGVLIVVHELGHWMASRAFKIEVEEFGVGFPPRLFRLFRAWGTDFTFNAIPLGGFVRPKGENDPTVEGGLAAASPWARIVVLFSGPAMNLLVAVLLGAILFYNLGRPVTNKVLIDTVVDNTPAQQAGLQKGDLIVEVNGQQIDGQEKFRQLIADNLEVPITLVVARGDERITTNLTPRKNPPEGQGAIGIIMTNPSEPITVSQALVEGANATYQNIVGILALPIRLIQGEASPEEGRVVGYYGMFTIYRQLFNPLLFFMTISISLGVINLFPIPPMDGARILFTLPEIIFRRRVPPRYETAISLVGFALLLGLLIYVNIMDFTNPIQLPK